MERKRRQRAFTIVEILVAIFLVGLILYIVMPRGNHTKNNVTAKTAAEIMVARLRQARETSMTKHVPVGIAIPATPAASYSNAAYQLEGEVQPQVTSAWKIEQDSLKVVYFVGQWLGPAWTPLATATDFPIATWNQYPPGPPPSANIFVFTPDGRVVSQADGFNGNYVLLVAQGVVARGSTLVEAATPWTITITPDGEIEVVAGLLGGTPAQIGQGTETAVGAVYTPAAAAPNQSPVFVGPLVALPDNTNPNNGNGGKPVMDVSSSLTLAANVTDRDGDPPFVTWSVTDVMYPSGTHLDPTSHGGRFGNFSDCRMEWSPKNLCWVARCTWTPAAADTQGGYYYQLQCSVDDRKGGTTNASFPISPGWLKTTASPWVLYRALGANGHWELWRVDLLGEEHHVVAAIPNQDISFAQWTSAGDEAVFGTTSGGVYRVEFDGSHLRQVATAPGLTIGGACLNPSGDTLYFYSGPPNGTHTPRSLSKISMVTGVETSVVTPQSSLTNAQDGLTCAQINGHDLLLQTFYYTYRDLFGPKHRDGVQAVDPTSGTQSTNGGGGTSIPAGLDVAESRGVDGGVHISPDGTTMYYGSAGGSGNLYSRPVNAAGYTGDARSFAALIGPAATYPTPVGDAHHPQPVDYNGHTGLVFVEGRGTAAQIYYMQDVASPGVVQRLNLAPGQVAADTPSVGPPR